MGSTGGRRAATRRIRLGNRSIAGVASVVGLAMVAPPLGTAPAQGVTPPEASTLVAPTPVIAPGGAGSIEFLGHVVCTSDGTAEKLCGDLPLDGLGDALTIVLTAVPSAPDEVPQWDPATCPTVLADTCSIPVTDLSGSTALAPVVTFLTSAGGGGTPEPLDTTITSAVPGPLETTHTFRFQASPDTPGTTTFECALQVTYNGTPPVGAQAAHDWRACGADPRGEETYSNLANGDYVFAVRALTAGVPDLSPATQQWTVATQSGGTDPGGTDPGSIDTTITGGPRDNGWVLRKTATYTFTSNVTSARFDCYVGDDMSACDTGSHTISVWKLRKGTHRFAVEAFTFAGQRDATPAHRRLNVPMDDRVLAASSGWTSKRVRGHFKNTVRETDRKGASLTTKGRERFRRVALIADTGRGQGTVEVFWKRRLLKEVRLQAQHTHRAKIIPIKRFTGAMRRGTLRIVVVSRGKPVRIDGLGLASR